jgi:hypothetical protein
MVLMNGLILPRLAWRFLFIRRVACEGWRSSVGERVGFRALVYGLLNGDFFASMAASSDDGYSADFKEFYGDRWWGTGRLSSLSL